MIDYKGVGLDCCVVHNLCSVTEIFSDRKMDASAQSYFSHVIQNAGLSSSLSVELISSKKGKGVIAQKDFAEGEVKVFLISLISYSILLISVVSLPNFLIL